MNAAAALNEVGAEEITDNNLHVFTEIAAGYFDGQTFGDHPLYYVTGCRSRWWVHYAAGSIIPIKIQTGDVSRLVFLKPLGPNCEVTARELAQSLAQATGQTIVVKNISEESAVRLRAQGFTDYPKDGGWSRYTRYDDQSFPEPKIDLEVMRHLRGGHFMQLRQSIRNGLKQDLRISPAYGETGLRQAREVLEKWIGEYCHRGAGAQADDLREFYRPILNFIAEAKSEAEICAWTVMQGASLVGAHCSVPVTSDTVDVYLNIYTGKSKDGAPAMLQQCFHRLGERGFSHANLGGSEFPGLHNFKMRFCPSQLIHRTHVVWNP